jgi:hypothetical protein
VARLLLPITINGVRYCDAFTSAARSAARDFSCATAPVISLAFMPAALSPPAFMQRRSCGTPALAAATATQRFTRSGIIPIAGLSRVASFQLRIVPKRSASRVAASDLLGALVCYPLFTALRRHAKRVRPLHWIGTRMLRLAMLGTRAPRAAEV